MLSADVDRYIALRRTLGYRLEKAERHLHAFARFAAKRNNAHIATATALEWVEAATSTPSAKAVRWTHLVHFARFLHAEDPHHEIPPASLFRDPRHRPVPYIYSPDEIARILDAAGKLRWQRPNPLRRELYVTLFGLIAATGLRISEAIALRLDDVRPDGVLRIRETKFRKNRLVPLHPSAMTALDRYLELRR